MVKRKTTNIIIFTLLFITIFVYRMFLVKNVLKYAEIILTSSLLIITALAVLFLGFKKNKPNFIKKSVMTVTVTHIILYFAITYGIGIFAGFLKNSYSLSFFSIIENIFAPIAMIICTEILRYVLISSNKDNKFVAVLITIALICIECSLQISLSVKWVGNELFKILTLTIIPSIMKHSVLSYLTYEVGYMPSLVYRLVIDISIYVLPFAPDLGDYLKSITTIALPFLVFVYSSRILNEYNHGVEHEFKESTFRWFDIPLIIIFVVLICLVSGFFPVYMIGIGSESMQPALDKGDAVVVNKINSETKIEKGMIVVFKNEGKTVVHRISEVYECDSDYGECYHTKGDYNNANDNVELTKDDIQGIVQFRIPIIAYPAVYISEILD